MSGPESIIALAVVATAGITAITLAKAFAQRIASGSGDASRGELRILRDELERQRAELDAVHERLVQVDELHNRVDFAERMLAQVKERTALPGGRT